MLDLSFRFLATLPRTPTDKVEKFRVQEQGVTADTWDRELADRDDTAAGFRPAMEKH